MAWQNTSLNVAGTTFSYDVYKQHDINNCGPSSIIMTANQALNRKVAIGFAQAMVGKSEQARGERTASGADARWHSWDNSSTGGYSGLNDLKTTLNAKWPGLNATDIAVDRNHCEKLAACTPAKPALAHVAWTGGGGHFIVCLGKVVGDAKMVFLDPYYGVVVCEYYAHQGRALHYSTAQNSFGRSAASAWSEHAIYTNPT